MLLILLTGLSGAGKSTIANKTRKRLSRNGFAAEVVDSDKYRKTICKDLGFSPDDRKENIRRVGKIAHMFLEHKRVVLLAAINPYEESRKELKTYDHDVKTVWIDCDLAVLEKRDTKGLYRKARLPDDHPEKIHNLTGINAPYEIPILPDLIIQTDKETENESVEKLMAFILKEINKPEAKTQT